MKDFIKILEKIFGCFHEWGTWEEYSREYTRTVFGTKVNKFSERWQKRYCKKCNKSNHERISQ